MLHVLTHNKNNVVNVRLCHGSLWKVESTECVVEPDRGEGALEDDAEGLADWYSLDLTQSIMGGAAGMEDEELGGMKTLRS